MAVLSAALGAESLALGVPLPVLASAGAHSAQVMRPPLVLPSALGVLADPTLIYGLLLLALLGVGVELVHPGALVPGIVGLVAGGLAIVGLLATPLNLLGLLLVGAAVALFILDVSVPSHGLVSILGIAASIAGGGLLFRHPGVNPIALLGLPLGMGAIWVIVSGRALEVRHRPFPQLPHELLGLTGVVRKRASPIGLAEVGGELWRIAARDESPLEVGIEIEVLAQDGLTLIVRPTGAPVPYLPSAAAEPAVRSGHPGGIKQ
ncbi:MAG: NfeD family protein [Candidatus Dormibacteria bacterium]